MERSRGLGWAGQTAEKVIGQMINEVTDRCDVVKYICEYKLHGKEVFS